MGEDSEIFSAVDIFSNPRKHEQIDSQDLNLSKLLVLIHTAQKRSQFFVPKFYLR